MNFLKTIFSIQRNTEIVSVLDEKNNTVEQKNIIGYKLLKDGKTCACPITNKYITVNGGTESKLNSNKLPVSVTSSLSVINQKNCSTQCAAFQLYEDKKKQIFKCNWGGFKYEIADVIDNEFKQAEKK